MEFAELGEVLQAFPDPQTSPESTVGTKKLLATRKHSSTVLFDLSWKESKTQSRPRLERQMSRPDYGVTLS